MKSYQEIYNELKSLLITKNTNDTSSVTNIIKEYFYNSYQDLYVAGACENSEFLFDISILSCDPYDITNYERTEYYLHIAIESELGGPSASSSKLVEKNVFFDFTKLLLSNANQKILIGAYSIPLKPKSTKTNELMRLREKFNTINIKSNNKSDILVILILGTHTQDKSRQIKLSLPFQIDAFKISKNEPYNIEILDG